MLLALGFSLGQAGCDGVNQVSGDAAVDAAVGEADAAPDRPPTILRAVAFNMCGGACNQGGLAALDAAVPLIDDFGPHLVFLQEACWSHYQAFADHYDGRYQASYATILTSYTGCGVADCAVNEDTDPGNDDPGCWVGNVVAAAGALLDPEAVPMGGNDNQVNGTTPVIPPREFHAACSDVALAALPTRAVRACSVHFRAFQDPGGINDAARLEQAINLTEGLADDVAAGTIVVVGGDFNAPPTKASLNPFYRLDAPDQPHAGAYYEADEDDGRYYAAYCDPDAPACRSGAVTLGPKGAGASEGTNKYDYVFFSETSDPATASALPLDVATSDHAFYRAQIEVASNPP